MLEAAPNDVYFYNLCYVCILDNNKKIFIKQ